MKDLKLKFNPNSERTPLANENGKDIFHLCNDAEYIAIYRRIVAAVNACQGIETNMLEVLPMGFKEHAMTMERIAELEECLQETLKALKEASNLSDNEGSDYTEEYREAIENAESVLIRKGPAGILTANSIPTPGPLRISQQAIDAFFDSIQPSQGLTEISIDNTLPPRGKIAQFVHASQFAMRLLSQNPDDAVAQACVVELAKAISNVVIYSTGPMIQKWPHSDNPEAEPIDIPAFMGYPIKQTKIPPGEWRFEGDEHPYNPADLDDF